MKRGITVLAVAAAAVGCTLSAGASTSPTALPRVTRTSLLYVGVFRLPAPTSDRHTFAYGGTALAYDPTRKGLFVVEHDWYQLDAEVSIPRPVRGGRRARPPRPRALHPVVDPAARTTDRDAR